MSKTMWLFLAVAVAIVAYLLLGRRANAASGNYAPVSGVAPTPQTAQVAAATAAGNALLSATNAVTSIFKKPAPLAGPANTNGGGTTIKAVAGTVAASAAVSGCAAAGGGPACALVAAPAAKVGTVAASAVGKIGSTVGSAGAKALSAVKFW